MTVLEFRKAVRPLDGVAETGAARFLTGPNRAVSTSQFPHNPHTDGFHASESFSEGFVIGDGLDSARGVYAWVGIMFAVECALGLFGWWIA